MCYKQYVSKPDTREERNMSAFVTTFTILDLIFPNTYIFTSLFCLFLHFHFQQTRWAFSRSVQVLADNSFQVSSSWEFRPPLDKEQMGHLNPVWLRKNHPSLKRGWSWFLETDRNDAVHSGPLTRSFYLFIYLLLLVVWVLFTRSF